MCKCDIDVVNRYFKAHNIPNSDLYYEVWDDIMGLRVHAYSDDKGLVIVQMKESWSRLYVGPAVVEHMNVILRTYGDCASLLEEVKQEVKQLHALICFDRRLEQNITLLEAGFTEHVMSHGPVFLMKLKER